MVAMQQAYRISESWQNSMFKDCSVELSLESTTNSASTLNLIKRWLNECEHSHVLCRSGCDANWTPTRLLDINEVATSSRVSLKIGSTIQPAPYITLTHRWGESDHQDLSLTTANVKKLCDGIGLYELPKLFRDAIDVAQHLQAR